MHLRVRADPPVLFTAGPANCAAVSDTIGRPSAAVRKGGSIVLALSNRSAVQNCSTAVLFTASL